MTQNQHLTMGTNVKVAQSCLTLCDPMNYSLPGSSVHGILQVRILQNTPCPGDLPKPGIEPQSQALKADSLSSEPPGKPVGTKDAPKQGVRDTAF